MTTKQWKEIKNKILYAIVIIVVTNLTSCSITLFGMPSKVNAMEQRIGTVEKGLNIIQSDIKLILKSL